MTDTGPITLQQHQSIVAEYAAELAAVPKDQLDDPSMPVSSFLGEAGTSLTAAEQYKAELEAVGFKQEFLAEAARWVRCLTSAQAVWTAERAVGRGPDVEAVIAKAEELRQDALDSGDLALRDSPKGLERLSRIREGDGLDDLQLDCTDLAVLMTDFRAEFEAIKYDVTGVSASLVGCARELAALRADAKVEAGNSTSKDNRDAAFFMAAAAVGLVRKFGKHAFRFDRNNTRRGAFTSAYERRRNLKARAKKKKAQPVDA